MCRVLHILVRSEDPLAAEVIAQQRNQPNCSVGVIDLAMPEPDYAALLEQIFEADSVEVW
jgi:DNA-binding NarL/FixJ family response regulator